jgi:hypothetical protein
LTRRTRPPQTEHHLLYHVEWWRCYYHFIRGRGAAERFQRKRYRPQFPMALGLTDRVWTVEVLRKPMAAALAA